MVIAIFNVKRSSLCYTENKYVIIGVLNMDITRLDIILICNTLIFKSIQTVL